MLYSHLIKIWRLILNLKNEIIKLKEDKDFDVKVLPTFRPDKAVEIKKEDFTSWIEKLTNISRIEINILFRFLFTILI